MSSWKNRTQAVQKKGPAFLGKFFSHVIARYNEEFPALQGSRQNGTDFHRGQQGSCNHRLSIFPHLSKVYERVIYKQIDILISQNSCRTYVALGKIKVTMFFLIMIEIRRQQLCKGNLVGVSLMDLSKGLDTINYSWQS